MYGACVSTYYALVQVIGLSRVASIERTMLPIFSLPVVTRHTLGSH